MLSALLRPGNSQFDAPNCSGRALRYYHRYLTELPRVQEGQMPLPIMDNNVGKDLSAGNFSGWICTAIVDSHAAFKSASISALEVRAMATSLEPCDR